MAYHSKNHRLSYYVPNNYPVVGEVYVTNHDGGEHTSWVSYIVLPHGSAAQDEFEPVYDDYQESRKREWIAQIVQKENEDFARLKWAM